MREKTDEPEVTYEYTGEMKLDITGENKSPDVRIYYPENTEEVVKIVRFAKKNNLPLTVVGGATNLSGATVPESGGIALSMKKMNKILKLDPFDRIAVVECGCNTQYFVDEVTKAGMFFPQNIASADRSTIGGNIAVSSGSPWSMSYGTTKNYILNLEVVLADGTILNTGKNVTKNATGYNLTQLFAGSEGTLGIVTRATFRLLVPRKFKMVTQLLFENEEKLFSAFRKIFVSGFDPVSVEYMDSYGVELVKSYLGENKTVKAGNGGVLWMEWEAGVESELSRLATELQLAMKPFTEDFRAESGEGTEQIWNYRRSIGYAVRAISDFDDIDAVVPRSRVKELYEKVREICREKELKFTAFAHIGDGNLHINLLKENRANEEWKELMDAVRSEVFECTIGLGGEISGEHGIGSKQKKYMIKYFPLLNRQLNKEIKMVFDPGNILNSQILHH